jgi:hypothetical protein
MAIGFELIFVHHLPMIPSAFRDDGPDLMSSFSSALDPCSFIASLVQVPVHRSRTLQAARYGRGHESLLGFLHRFLD